MTPLDRVTFDCMYSFYVGSKGAQSVFFSHSPLFCEVILCLFGRPMMKINLSTIHLTFLLYSFSAALTCSTHHR